MTDESIVHKPSRIFLAGSNAAPEVLEFLSNEKQVTKDTPPAFIAHSTTDTTSPIANSDEYVAALIKKMFRLFTCANPSANTASASRKTGRARPCPGCMPGISEALCPPHK